MTYRIYVRLKSGETAISRKLYEGWPPSYGTELKVPLAGGDTVEVRIGTPHTDGNKNGGINADEI
ncbi:MAG: hypothetical protein WAK55_29915 [Xanthobacteraceae bacterium]